MSIKEKLRKVLPSMRARDRVLEELNGIQKQIRRLDQKISDLDGKNEYLFYCLQHLNDETDLETKKRVFLNLPKASGQLADVQLVSDYILRRIKTICDENGISFSLSGGTLLGSVRHHGFIPWDDDVDINVMRSDFQLFEKCINSDHELVFRKYYAIENNGENPYYIYKVKLKDSDLFFVDVFIRDSYWSNDENANQTWSEIVSLSVEHKRALKDAMESIGFKCESDRGVIIPRACSELDEIVQSIDEQFNAAFTERFGRECGTEYGCLGIDQPTGFVKKEKLVPWCVYYPYKENVVTFQGKLYDAYNDYLQWLEIQFGEYWALPPAINQEHRNQLLDWTEKDYEVVDRIRLGMTTRRE